MKNYQVKNRVNHDNEDFEIGSTIALEDKHAKPLLAIGAIVEIEPVDNNVDGTAAEDALAEQVDSTVDDQAEEGQAPVQVAPAPAKAKVTAKKTK
ncbi:MAG TPA: hypothetical protein DCG63_03750 [Methylophilaceae bacterium]|nr:hypothetical protein [Methylophilaceae bacterium]